MNASSVFADFRAAGNNVVFDFSTYGFSFSINLTTKGFERIQLFLLPTRRRRSLARTPTTSPRTAL